MKIYYVKDVEDYRTPETLVRQDWCGNVVEETTNEFTDENTANKWCYIMNSGYISRRPYAVRSFEKK